MKRCVGIRRKDEISGGSLDACFWMLAFGQWVVRVHGMRSGSKKLNYFLKNYARVMGSWEVRMGQCITALFLSSLT